MSEDRLQRLARVLSFSRTAGRAIVATAGALAVVAGLGGCGTGGSEGSGDGDFTGFSGGKTDGAGTTRGGTVGGMDTTFDHPAGLGGEPLTPREALKRMEEEGPPAYRARVHGCRKPRYRTIGRVLRSLGVDLNAEGDLRAGRMWRRADQSLGAPNYGARLPESSDVTVASTSRLFDILVQAAPEIMENLPAQQRCAIGGEGVELFDEAGGCTRDGLSCLLGEPATSSHVELCNDTVRRAPTEEEGRRIAIASLLAANLTCE